MSDVTEMSEDLEYLKHVYAAARRRYQPRHVSVLLVAESPPSALDRFFYFDDVKSHDSLFLEVMGVLYPDQKTQYLAARRDTALKRELLERFKDDGYWMTDIYEVAADFSKLDIDEILSSFLRRIDKVITKETCIVLIKASIYDLCYEFLKAKGYSVIDERIPFQVVVSKEYSAISLSVRSRSVCRRRRELLSLLFFRTR